jgi:hypothetical protein
MIAQPDLDLAYQFYQCSYGPLGGTYDGPHEQSGSRRRSARPIHQTSILSLCRQCADSSASLRHISDLLQPQYSEKCDSLFGRYRHGR